MKPFKFIILSLFVFACSDKTAKTVVLVKDTAFSGLIDTSYKFRDPSKERIVISYSLPKDSSFQYLQFKYFRKVSADWQLIHSVDSLVIWNGFETDHKDFNGDGINDFVFLAANGGRVANYFQHLLLFDGLKGGFQYMKGFDQVCAPAYDLDKQMIVGTSMSGAYRDVRYYLIKEDSVILKNGEVWEDDRLIKRYHLMNGKEIIDITSP